VPGERGVWPQCRASAPVARSSQAEALTVAPRGVARGGPSRRAAQETRE